MNDGRVEQIGAPLELYDRPANLFVAGFIGSPAMNFLTGTASTEGGIGFRTSGGLTMPISGAVRAQHGQPVIYGVRPEHFLLTDEGVPAEVVVLEPTGSETQAQLRVDGQDVTGVFRERLTARPGETIRILPQAELVHLFDPQTRQRLI
jgi:multiple sugar transport system ATP-binding protein